MANAHNLLMAQRAAMMGGKQLPYLRRVAYLESHGREFIDTGIILDEYSSVTCVNTLGNQDQCAFGSRYSAYDRAFMHFFGSSNSKMYFAFGRQNIEVSLSQPFDGYNIKLKSHIQNGNFSVIYYHDGGAEIVSSRAVGVWSGTNNLNCYLFAANQSNQINRPLVGKIYEIEFHGVAKFIPVLDLSGRPAMYDEVSGHFFYNQGTGEFTWGELET